MASCAPKGLAVTRARPPSSEERTVKIGRPGRVGVVPSLTAQAGAIRGLGPAGQVQRGIGVIQQPEARPVRSDRGGPEEAARIRHADQDLGRIG